MHGIPGQTQSQFETEATRRRILEEASGFADKAVQAKQQLSGSESSDNIHPPTHTDENDATDSSGLSQTAIDAYRHSVGLIKGVMASLQTEINEVVATHRENLSSAAEKGEEGDQSALRRDALEDRKRELSKLAGIVEAYEERLKVLNMIQNVNHAHHA
ncbi:hypothetical protein CPC08DRAFT_707045 [Agrocybe pediades]|nr:hypothetical protein CPC08DRAFT_707045 [Agrocybe pediades]